MAIPRPLLALAVGHALAGWAFWVGSYDDLAQASLTPGRAVAGLLVTWMVLAVWLVGVAAAMRLAPPLKPPGQPPLSHAAAALRHGLSCVAMSAGVVVVAWLFRRIILLPGVFGAFWVLAFACAGAALLLAHALQPDGGWLDPRRRVPTSALLAPTAAFAWSLFVVLELLFHHYGGAFVILADMSVMVQVMSEEAVAMLFGPAALSFLSGLAVYGAVCAVLALLTARRRSRPAGRRELGIAGVVALLGLASLGGLDEPGRALVLHHIHPQVDDLALALGGPAAPTPDDQAAAERLYPGVSVTPPPPVEVSLADYASRAQAATPQGHDNVLVVFIDTVSRDHLEPWGYERPISPHIAALARESVRYDGARTNGGTTDLATVSLFYGLRPWLAANKTDTYLLGHGGLPFHLLAAAGGRRTGLFSGDWEIWEHGQSPVFPRLCDRFLDARLAKAAASEGERDYEVDRWAGMREDHLVDALLPWLDERAAAGERFVAYLKLFRPHMPYDTPESLPDGWRRPFLPAPEEFTLDDMDPSDSRAPLLLNKYDNAVHFVDHQLGRVLDHLRTRLPQVWANTAVVLTADHGEAWGEHGWFMHGHHNYEEFFRIPLLIRRPGVPPGVDDRPVALMDVAPTIVDLLGLPPYENHQGRSLLRPGPRPPWWGHSNSAARLTTLQVDNWKYTENLLTGEALLHDLAADPHERTDLAWSADPAHVERRAALRWLLHTGNAAQLEWAEALRAWPTRRLLGP